MGLRKSNVLYQSATRLQKKWGRLQGNLVPGEREGQSSISDIRISPLVQSRWSQGTAGGQNCYNYYIPNNWACGCAATAMAQLMRFHQHPNEQSGYVVSGKYRYKFGDYDEILEQGDSYVIPANTKQWD